MPEKLQTLILKVLEVTELPADLKLTGPENWASWSNLMIAIAELSGFDIETLKRPGGSVSTSPKYQAKRSSTAVKEGKMLGLLIKFNISAAMNELVSVIMDGYEAWAFLRLYCAQFADKDVVGEWIS